MLCLLSFIVLTKLCTPLGLEDYSTVRDTARLTNAADTLLNLINHFEDIFDREMIGLVDQVE
jgi:hypothetical protein